jgi:hypothetical protein
MFDPNQALPDFQSQQQELERKRAMAEMLRKQSGSPMPQGQMVGNQYVAPSFAQYLPGLLNAAQSAYAQKQVGDAEKEYGQQVAQAKQQWQSSLPQATAAIPGREELYGPREMGGSPELDAVPEVPAQLPDTSSILKATLAGMNIPGNEKVAGLWNQGMLAEKTREDTQAARKAETEARMAQEKELVLERLRAQREIAEREAKNTQLGIEQRAEAAKNAARLQELIIKGQQEFRVLTKTLAAANRSKPDDENEVKFRETDASGKVTLFNKYGRPIGEPMAVGKPTAAFEKTATQKKQLSTDLDRTIAELTDVTKDGGLIDQSTGSGIGRGVDIAAGMFGKATPGAIAIGKLAPIADMALKMVPRFEGPQSNKDTTSYERAAGELANSTLPNEIRKEAGRTVLRLMKERKNQFVTKDMAAEGLGAAPATPAKPGSRDIGGGFKIVE